MFLGWKELHFKRYKPGHPERVAIFGDASQTGIDGLGSIYLNLDLDLDLDLTLPRAHFGRVVGARPAGEGLALLRVHVTGDALGLLRAGPPVARRRVQMPGRRNALGNAHKISEKNGCGQREEVFRL